MAKRFKLSEDEFDNEVFDVNKKEVKMIDVELIGEDPDNEKIYGEITEQEIRFLAEDIRKNGFKGTVLIYPAPSNSSVTYTIESGHRRFLAAKSIGMKEIPAIITDAPKSDAERQIRLISMNLHSRDALKPSVTVKVIDTLSKAHLEKQKEQGLSTEIGMINQLVADDMEVSVKTIEKYKMLPRLIPELQRLADNNISWSALINAATFSGEDQMKVFLLIERKIHESGEDRVSRAWIQDICNRIKSEGREKEERVSRKKNAAKVIQKYADEIPATLNDNVFYRKKDIPEMVVKLNEIKQAIEAKILELENAAE